MLLFMQTTGADVANFWRLTPAELSIVIKLSKLNRQNKQLEIGVLSWYSGLATKIDTNKVSFRKWMDQFDDPGSIKQRQKEQLEEGKIIWQRDQK
jgi:hypothetical protein